MSEVPSLPDDEDASATPEALREFGDPTRRTYLAAERTLLAWWRTSFAALGVALAVGRLLPDVAHLPKVPFLILGVGWGLLAAALIVFGTVRDRQGHSAIRAGKFAHLDRRVTALLAVYVLVLIIATTITSFWRS
jgi:putative membrane protein